MQVIQIKIDYPPEKPSLRVEGGKELIYCPLRKRWLSLTPEEWVRQNFILHLFHKRQFPLSLMAAERQIRVGEMNKRFDLLVFDREGQPYLIVECKEMNVPLSESVLQQALNYNMKLRAPFLAVTNGSFCSVFQYAPSGFTPCADLPQYH